ncbi:AraC family transcriptional regulator [Curtobacterium herbarum]|uniref:HTH araC/xylS-type domain-containing protein n=1 Tax=Curtobacterium herbarum TaxID=150122 RepID=A0ABN1Z8T7_9MICO|nr:helix-turn-helix domain-containing protein [Curtobacterium herbarum]MBM7476364.1 AraC-like DNA-binding protein [Curtobacterium herbarum]MCS6544070.1 helix-turn-helix domain-containing protein [Curtobacterium herbarum]
MTSMLDAIARRAETTTRGADAVGPVRIEAAGSSSDAVVADVGRLYDGHDWEARTTDHPFAYRYSAVGDSDVTLRRSQIGGTIRGAIPRSADYVVQWITAGYGVPDVTEDRVPLQLDVPMLFPTAREFVFEYQDYDQRLVHMSRRLVHEVADELFHTGQVTDLGIDHLRTLDPAAITQWRSSLAMLSRELKTGGVDTLLWHTLTRGTAAAFLRMYPPTATALPPAVLLPRRTRLRAAVEYVHEHVAEPMSVSDIAEAAGLSVRATQEAFQRHLDQTPMTYLLRARLDRVRRDLLQADASATSVQDIARRWGFAHLGRFSAAYRNEFGEYPRATLRS